MVLGSGDPSARVNIGLVGGGKGGSALLDLLLDWPAAQIAVVVDRRRDAPALEKAKAHGIPTAAHHLEVFAYPVDLVLEVTGSPAVLEDLLRAKPHGVEVIGAGGLHFFWNLLQERKAAEERLVQSERLRAFGQLVNGVAHDFSELLTVIVGRVQLLLRKEELEPDLARQFQVIEQAALDGAQTIQRIQQFASMRSPRPHVAVDLAELLEEVVEISRPRWRSEAEARGISYDIRIEAEPVPLIAGDPVELLEVFGNLVQNALEAMPQGGQVRLTAAKEGERVRVTVQDTGYGMSAEVRRRAFEPFFTTKGRQGTGLGLSVAWGIVRRHRGEITIDTEEGKGTTITLRFPVHAVAVEPEPIAPRSWSPRRGKILIIDDEPEVRAVLREFLEAQGHTVVEAADGPTGLARCEAERFDLVLTDLSMPRMSGLEVAAILKRRANLPVGLITGWGDQLDPAELTAKSVDFVLAKPFQLGEVLQCVGGALASAEESSSSR